MVFGFVKCFRHPFRYLNLLLAHFFTPNIRLRSVQRDLRCSVHSHPGARSENLAPYASQPDPYLRQRIVAAVRALEIHQKLLPVYTGTFRTQGAILTKAALTMMGLPGGFTRLPLVDATDAQIAQLREDLRAGGVTLK